MSSSPDPDPATAAESDGVARQLQALRRSGFLLAMQILAHPGAAAHAVQDSFHAQEQWSRIIKDATARSSRAIGWVLLILGVLVVTVHGAYQFAVDDEVSALIKTGAAEMLAYGTA
ncbi:MAG TPA: hypothetical protein EYP56_20050, partial [Planctomycetaceae bacterium]|nr:hypothetical protein [Planctomycetaceae bacterium]